MSLPHPSLPYDERISFRGIYLSAFTGLRPTVLRTPFQSVAVALPEQPLLETPPSFRNP